MDVGTFSTETVDYPDFAEAVGLSLLKNQADRGILICCSGVGASVAATKLPVYVRGFVTIHTRLTRGRT